MNTIDTRERDLSLKLRVMRYLWHLGYFVRHDVDLVSYIADRREREYTDIDVMGIAFDETFERKLTLCDCKTGSGASNPERIMILAGLVRYLRADMGLYVREYIAEHKYAEFANRLNVRAISSSQLEILEKSIGIDTASFFGVFSRDQERAAASFNLLKKFDKQAYECLLVQNWFDPPHQRILTFVSCCKAIKSLTSFSDDARAFLLANTLSHLGLAVIEFARESLFVKDEDRGEFVKQGLVGGRLSFYERRKLLSDFYEFMVQEIQAKYKQKYPIPKKEFVDYVIPPYAKYVVDLVSRLCVDPRNALYTPRIIDLVAYERILYGNRISLAQLGIQDHDIGKAALLSASDLVTFASRADIIDQTSKTIMTIGLEELRS